MHIEDLNDLLALNKKDRIVKLWNIKREMLNSEFN